MQTITSLEVRPSAAALGADVIGFPFQDYSAGDIRQLYSALLRHQVLRFRSAELADGEQIRFTNDLAPFVIDERQPQHGPPPQRCEFVVISNMKNPDGTPIGHLGDSEVTWHTDTWFRPRPFSFSVLRALAVPAFGGNTQFSNMYRAYETLPRHLKSAIAGRMLHHQTVYTETGTLRLGMSLPASTDIRTWPGVDHPIVRTHIGTGRKCLYLGRRPRGWIIGLPLNESDQILDALWRHATWEEFTWTQVWRQSDMLLWDNRCILHRRDGFDPNTGRLMHRTTLSGERPI